MRLHSPQSRLILDTENRKGPGRAGGVGRDEAQQTEKQKSQSGRRPLQTPLSLQPALLLLFCFVFFFLDRVSWCHPSCPGILYVDQAGPNSTCPSLVLGLKA